VLNFYLDFEEVRVDEEEFLDTKAAIDELLEQGDRGEGRPAERFRSTAWQASRTGPRQVDCLRVPDHAPLSGSADGAGFLTNQ